MKKHHIIIFAVIIILLYFLLRKTTTQVTSTLAGRPIQGSGVPVSSSILSRLLDTFGAIAHTASSTVAATRTGASGNAPVGPTLAQLGGGANNPTPGIALQPTLAQLTGTAGNIDPLLDPTLGDLPLSTGGSASIEPLLPAVGVDPSSLDSSVFDYPSGDTIPVAV